MEGQMLGDLVARYRLRQGDMRVFYDVFEDEVVILAIVYKNEADDWLNSIWRRRK